MKILGYIRPDGSVGIRNKICFLSSDWGADPVCKRVAAAVKGAVAMPHQKFNNAGEMNEDVLKSLIMGTAVNPNVAAVIIIGGKSENTLTLNIADGVAKTGRLVEVINTSKYNGVIGASAMALSTAVKMARDITTYRREPVKISKLNIGIWLEKRNPKELNLSFNKCCNNLVEQDCGIIGNIDLRKANGKTDVFDKEEKDISVLIKNVPELKKPGFKLLSSRSRKAFEELAVAGGANILAVAMSEGHVPEHPLVPVIRITADREYYEIMKDTVELDLSHICIHEPDPDGAGLLILNEILATCSGKLTKCEILGETEF